MAPDLPALINGLGGGNAVRELPEDDARALFAAMLAGAVPPAGLHAALVAHVGTRGSVSRTIGFVRALAAHAGRLDAPPDRPRPVLLPAADGTRAQPNLTALLALLLTRYGVPVLVHGLAGGRATQPAAAPADRAGQSGGDRSGRATSAAVLCELGILPATDLADAQSRLLHHNIAYVPTDVLAPGLARLLACAQSPDVRSALHSLATLIDPFGGDAYRVVCAPRPNDLPRLREIVTATRANALLLCGTEGEPFADPCRPPQLEHFLAGVGMPCAGTETEGVAESPRLPAAIDAPTTAAWIAQALAGAQPLPAAIVAQLGCCLNGAHRAAGAAENSALP